MRQWTIAILTAMLVSGCAASTGDDRVTAPPSGSPSASQESPVPLAPVTVTRTGGLAGMSDTYVIAPDGTMSIDSRREPASGTKKLTPDEQSELRSLVTAPALRAEATSDALVKRTCADGFVYTVTSGDLTIKGMDCGTLATDAPTLWKIIELVQNAATRAG